MSSLSTAIKDQARELGFSAAGIVPALPSPQLDAYLRWLDKGMHGSMGYLARPDRIARRRDLTAILPNAQSLIVVSFDYGSALPRRLSLDPSRGRISNYAGGLDYHPIMMQRLGLLAELVRRFETGYETRCYVDTGAIMERSHAEQAGLGFVGKNTMLIHPRRGSYFFLGEIITTLDLDYDEPSMPKMPGCGTCTRCLTACPTRAFADPYVLDSRRCISYLTIEHRGSFPMDLRPLIGNWVYGCDICQEICPWQRFSKPTGVTDLMPIDTERAAPPLAGLLSLSSEQFEESYRDTAIHRIGRQKLVSNSCIAAGNSAQAELRPFLIPLLRDADVVVRSHAAWALGRLGGGSEPLKAALLVESDVGVRHEMAEALSATR
jgi:epoxyqueuosine reductase